MSLYTISRSELRAPVPTPAGLSILESTNVRLLAHLGTTTESEVTRRLANDHLAFVAYIHHQPAAFGWMARGKATIGELNHSFVLPMRNRYLWNFRTLPDYRGLGIYPALLQYIMQYEGNKASRFWIIHAPENQASLKGIQKAGFEYVGQLYTGKNEVVTIEATAKAEHHRRLLAYMDIQLSEEKAASCWNCSSPFLKKRTPDCCCAKVEHECADNRFALSATH